MYSSTVTHFEEPRKRNNGLPEDIAAEPVQVPLEAAEQPLIWRNVIGLAIMYTVAVYTLVFRYRDIKFWTWIFGESPDRSYIRRVKITFEMQKCEEPTILYLFWGDFFVQNNRVDDFF